MNVGMEPGELNRDTPAAGLTRREPFMTNGEPSSRRRKDRKRRKKELQRRVKHKHQDPNSPPDDSVMGYVAMRGQDVLCDAGQYCVVTGSRSGMKTFIENHGLPARDYQIAPATADHILTAMSMGGQYAFDRESYLRMLGPASAAGLRLEPVEFADAGSEGIFLVRVGPYTP